MFADNLMRHITHQKAPPKKHQHQKHQKHQKYQHQIIDLIRKIKKLCSLNGILRDTLKEKSQQLIRLLAY